MSAFGPSSSGFFSNTPADGKYRIGGLRTGDYRVRFTDCVPDGVNYVAEYYDDVAAYEDANLVPVRVGRTKSRIDAVLDLGAVISGTVTVAATGAVAPGVVRQCPAPGRSPRLRR